MLDSLRWTPPHSTRGSRRTTALGRQLYIAARDGKKEVVKLSEVLQGRDVSARPSSTRVITAGRRSAPCGLNGHEEIVKLLLDAGANKEATSSSGGTRGLFLAAAAANEAVVKLLLEAGANKDAMDKFGETALVMATNEGHDAVVALLKPPAADEDEFSSPASKRMKTEKEPNRPMSGPSTCSSRSWRRPASRSRARRRPARPSP